MAIQEVKSRLACRDLRHSYDGRVDVLNGVSLEIADGETVAIMGQSGSGKSTLLQCLACLQPVKAGDCCLAGQVYLQGGEPLFELNEVRAEIQMVFQDYRLFANMTVMDNLILALRKVRRLQRADAEEIARDMARRLGISELLSRFPQALSGGQAQRVALGRAAVLKPSVLLLDEITSALDPESVGSVMDTLYHIRSLNQRPELGILVVTHLLGFAIRFADRIGFLNKGILVDVLPAREFVARAENPATKSFIERSHSIW